MIGRPCALDIQRYSKNMNNALDTRLAAIDSAIAIQDRIIETYEGMLSYCNDGEGADSILVYLDKAQIEKARLEAEWNGLV